MAHISNLGLLMEPYIISSLVIVPAGSCTIFNSPGSIQHCSHVALVTCRTTIVFSVPPGTHLHINEVEHLRVKCIVQGHNIDTTMSQR